MRPAQEIQHLLQRWKVIDPKFEKQWSETMRSIQAIVDREESDIAARDKQISDLTAKVPTASDLASLQKAQDRQDAEDAAAAQAASDAANASAATGATLPAGQSA